MLSNLYNVMKTSGLGNGAVRSRSDDAHDRSCARRRTFVHAITPGIYRGASKPDVFVTLCRFDNIYEKYEQLRHEKTAFVKGCVAAGYALGLKCKLAKVDEEEVEVYFSLHCGSGEWDNYVEWPFRKEVTDLYAPWRQAK
ncbi:hypothetical protein MTO96_012575 [Rhipicephalus appendiculatus]